MSLDSSTEIHPNNNLNLPRGNFLKNFAWDSFDVWGKHNFRPNPENSFDFKNSDTFVCVQGVFSYPGSMHSIGNEIKEQGKNVMYLKEKKRNNYFEKTKNRIISVINENKENIPNNGDIILVGHSLGALCTLFASTHSDIRSRIKGLVSLSGSFKEDKKYWLLVYKNLKDLYKPSNRLGNMTEDINSTFLSNGTFHDTYTTAYDRVVQEASQALEGTEVFETGSNIHSVYKQYPELFVSKMIENIYRK